MSARSTSKLSMLFSFLVVASCSRQPAASDVGLDAGCPNLAGVTLTQSQANAAISGIKRLISGKLSFDTDPTVVQLLTDARRADLIVASLMCTAEKRGDITSTDVSRVEYTRKLFLYTWGTSPVPGPEDVQAWTTSHSYSHVTPDASPSGSLSSFAAEHLDAVDPKADTCTQHAIPGGVSVCIRIVAGAAVGVYAAEAHDHGVLLTSVHPAQSASWFKQNVDYAVCARLTPDEHADNTQLAGSALEVESLPREQCLGAENDGAPAAATSP